MATATLLSAKKAGGKQLPAEKTPRQYSSFLSLQSSMMSQKKNTMALQISSAGLDRIKELKNEIFELRQKVEASSLENHVLKQFQRRHSKAIGRYESSESKLTNLLAGHYNEVRTLRKLLRMSQEDEKKTSRKLKKVEAELLKAKDALQTLHVLSENKALAEREELDHRLSVLTEKIEVNDKRIQNLEKQVKLNNRTFSRQLANENKKAMEAGIITKNLQMEINALHQKIKEKDRQLYIKYIYANWMPKIPEDKNDQSLSINTSVQVDRESFRSLLLSQYQTQETEKSPVPLIKEKKFSEDKNEEVEEKEAYADGQCRTEMPSTNELPKPETSNRIHRGIRLLMEEYPCLEFMKEEENEADLLKQEMKKKIKTEETPPSDSVKEKNQEEDNNPEKDTVEEYEQEEKKAPEQLMEYPCLEFMKEEENEADWLKQEMKKKIKTEETPPSDSVKEKNQEEDNNPEKDTVEEYEQEEKKAPEQLMEYPCLEFMKEEENEADWLKQEMKKKIKTEETPLSDSVKENNQEEDNNPEKDTVEEYEQEEKKALEQLNKSEEPESKCVTPGPSKETTSGVQKPSMFSEVIENLHHGLPTSGTNPAKGSLCNRRRAGQDSSETAESKVKNSSGLYEPSFGKVTKTRQKDTSTEAEGCTHMTCAGSKKSYERTLRIRQCLKRPPFKF
ncbi:PREDICTED: lebercilin-like protein [Apaloderma vittatum]|uniref:lebercilin-like protein n=1 Tax=Apaloderma vittatum TaxID=57397 RepID=UPI000521A574|nr:PREDICTED: lebercilin-like protein [Apaloderma vittatum]